ncbi:MAG: lysophospholipid acyltransferase family protein [Candidatus Kapabacteria bacterium]|nr:lysophospholipid acyltransferase family protein [Candidatus Kapabacteria bacterium]
MNDGILIPRISSTAVRFWRWYFRRSLTSAFFAVYSIGEPQLQPIFRHSAEQNIPIIFYATHGGWWDAALAIHFSLNRFRRTTYGLMEYKQLVKYKFFTKIGMLSIVRENARSALTSISIAANLIQNTGSLFWIFPQGEIVHQDKGAIEVFPGLSLLLRACRKAYCIPVSMRYDFLQEQRPEAFIRFGKPELIVWDGSHSIQEMTEIFRQQLAAEAMENRHAVIGDVTSGYEKILDGTLSMEKVFDRVKKQFSFSRNHD